jgi:uracil-DNA glycosylase family 4
LFVFGPPPLEAITNRAIPVGPEAEFFESVITKGLKYSADQVYVTSVSKCPVADPGSFEENFPMKACLNTLFREIELVGPKAVVALGETAAKQLTGMEKTQFAFLRHNKWVIGRGQKAPMRVTFDLPTVMELIDIKREFWNDLKVVLSLIKDG